MNRLQLIASHRLWERRKAYRLRKWRSYRDRKAQTPAVLALRHKWWELYELAAHQVSARDEQLAAVPKADPSSREAAVKWALSHVGAHEEPPGSNRSSLIDSWQRRFGFLGAPWCGIFCGNALVYAGVKGVTSRIASVNAIREDAEARRGCFSGWTRGATSRALRGDLVNLFGPGVHVELITDVYADGAVDTVGGNTSPAPGSGSEFAGGCVAARRRAPSEIYGVAHVHYG